MSKVILITGGSRSGKSTYAENFFLGQDDVLYIATAIRSDGEMSERIARHRARRNSAWATHEGFTALCDVVRGTPSQNILLDCCTLWFTNLLFSTAGVDFDGENITSQSLDTALDLVSREAEDVIAAARQCGKTLVLVTNEVGWGLVSEYPLGRLFSDLTGIMNQRMAAKADEVVLTACGLPLRLK
jgi:adenosylcobinamide kinase / adenosylcobinamide-phosphate guanylyltransferase